MIRPVVFVIAAVFSYTCLVSAAPVEDDPYKGCGLITKVLKPVCGSDGVLYDNKSIFQCAKTKNKNLKIVSKDNCEDDEDSAGPPPEQTVDPVTGCLLDKDVVAKVCGSNGKSYQNLTYLFCAQKTNPAIKIADDDVCKKH